MEKDNYSLNILTGEKYLIPKEGDKENIDNFLSNHKRKKVIVVQGLGFVGAVMTLICSNALTEEYAVIGVDLANSNNYWKIASINEGIFPVVASDPKINEYYEKAKEKANFYATYDPYAYSKANVIIVDINLDVAKNSDFNGELKDFNVDLTPFKKAIKSIGDNCNLITKSYREKRFVNINYNLNNNHGSCTYAT